MSPRGPGTEVRFEGIDVLSRFWTALTLRDSELLCSVLDENAVLDLTGPALRLWTTLPSLRGRRAILQAWLSATVDLETTHSMREPWVTALHPSAASVSALVEESYRSKLPPDRPVFLTNLYDVDMKPAAAGWVISGLRARNLRVSGDESLLWLPTARARRAASQASSRSGS